LLGEMTKDLEFVDRSVTRRGITHLTPPLQLRNAPQDRASAPV
jgi:hypothetical protein